MLSRLQNSLLYIELKLFPDSHPTLFLSLNFPKLYSFILCVWVHVHTCVFLDVFQVRICWVSYYASDILNQKNALWSLFWSNIEEIHRYGFLLSPLAKIKGNPCTFYHLNLGEFNQTVIGAPSSFWEGILIWNVEGDSCFHRTWICEDVCNPRGSGSLLVGLRGLSVWGRNQAKEKKT